jgi:hypothetical protein
MSCGFVVVGLALGLDEEHPPRVQRNRFPRFLLRRPGVPSRMILQLGRLPGAISLWSAACLHLLDLFLCVLAQFSPARGCRGPGDRIVASFGGWLMGHNSATVSSNMLLGILRAPPAVPLLVDVPVRKARFAPRTGITHRQEGVVIVIGALSHLAGVLPAVLGTRLPACRAPGFVRPRGSQVASMAGSATGSRWQGRRDTSGKQFA